MFRNVAEANDARFTGIGSYHAALAADRIGDPAAAQQWLDRALKADNSLDSALLYLGVVREKQRDFAGAGEAYKEYMKRHPDSIVAMLRFGVCAYRAGFHETAKKYLQQVVHLAPSSTEAAEARKFLVMWD